MQGRPDLQGCFLGWTLPTDSGIHAIRLKFGTPIFPLDTVDGSHHRHHDVLKCGRSCIQAQKLDACMRAFLVVAVERAVSEDDREDEQGVEIEGELEGA